jgi:hypothetical protein
MKKQKSSTSQIWYKAKLSPMAKGLFTEAFYPKPKRGTGAQYVYFTQIDVTPTNHKIVVASRLAESGVRMLTQDLAQKCLIPTDRATKAEMAQLNELSSTLKL